MSDELAQINAAYPHLHIHSARPLPDTSQHNKVIVINDSLIFRFPRLEETAQQMLNEIQILRTLKQSVSLPIPDPIYVHLDPESNKLLFMGYPMLAGRPITYDTLAGQPESVVRPLAKQLADFLRALHATPPASLATNLPIDGTPDTWRKIFEAIREKLYPFMRPAAQAQVTATFEAALNDPAFLQFTPLLCHGDFGTSNILCDPVTLQATGIIDFTLCGLGDPAQDVGAVMSLGENFTSHFLDYYPEMQATLPRVKFIRSTYPLQQALYALEIGNQADFDDGLQDFRA
jgi:aminoglycoside 2''-phosphotransferase